MVLPVEDGDWVWFPNRVILTGKSSWLMIDLRGEESSPKEGISLSGFP
jgi:hypothetical protein